MKNLTPILKYMGLFLLAYVVLFSLASWTPVAEFTNSAYRAVTAPILAAAFPEAYLKMEPDNPPESDPYTIRAVFISQKKIEEAKAAARQAGSAQVDLRAQEYDLYLHLLFTSFLVFLVALILVTPIKWLDKLIAIVVGGLLFYAYTVLKIGILLLDLFHRSAFDMYKLSETGGQVVGALAYVLKSLGVSAFVVVFLWILVAFRKSNLRGILRQKLTTPA